MVKKQQLWLSEIDCKKYSDNVSDITGWHIGTCMFLQHNHIFHKVTKCQYTTVYSV